MRMRILALIAVLGMPGVPVWACSCALNPNPPCQAAWDVSAVFTGTVIDITEPQPPRPVSPPFSGERVTARRSAADPPRSDVFRKREIRLSLGEVLTGISAGETQVSVLTGMGGGDCGYRFERGAAYVVYAYRNAQGQLEAGICSRTRPIADAAEDLAYIHAAAQAPSTGDIRIVTGFFNRPGTPGVPIQLQSGGSHYAAVTGADREARFPGLPPGEYKVSGDLEGYFPFERALKLHAKGCAEVLMTMALDRRITGRVFTKDGQPAAGVVVQAQRPQDPWGDSVKTDAEGRYELRHFSAGGYYLGINLSTKANLQMPYPRWFYPGTEDPTQAAVIFFSDKPDIQHYDLTLPDAQRERIIAGAVFWPDGRPASGAGLVVLDTAWLWQAPSAQTTADDQGRFTLRVLDGTAYRLHAVVHVGSPGGPRSADPVDIQPGTDPLNLRVIVARPGDSVAEDRRRAAEQFRNRR